MALIIWGSDIGNIWLMLAFFLLIALWILFLNDQVADMANLSCQRVLRRRIARNRSRQPNWLNVMLLSALIGAIVSWPVTQLFDAIFK